MATRTPRLPAVPMTRLDRAIAAVAPQWAAKRVRARGALLFYTGGGYTGARSDKRSMKDWDVRDGSANAVGLGDLPALRARSHDLARNNALARGAIQTQVTNVVGVGLVPNPRLDREVLGLDEETATRLEREIAWKWSAWADSPDCDLSRRLDFAAQQEVVLRGQLLDGDHFALRRHVPPTPGRRSPVSLAVQLIEGGRVANPMGEMDRTDFAGGLELDEHGVVTTYHVYDEHPADGLAASLQSHPVPAYGESGERLMLHVARWERAGELRPVPYLAPVIEPLRELGVYSESELRAAVVSSFFTVFLTSQTGDEIGTGVGDSGAVVVEQEPQTATAADVQMGPAAVVNLAPGDGVQFADPKRPNDKFDPFVQAILRQIGVALEIPFELLIKHYTASYSAARAAMLDAWRAFTTRRHWLVRGFCQPVYDWFVMELVLTGQLDAPGFLADPVLRAAWSNAEWRGPTQPQIDPMKEVDAAAARVDAGFSTIEQETAQLTGGDWETNHAQQVKERRARVRDGLASEPTAMEPQVPVGRKSAPVGDDESEEEE